MCGGLVNQRVKTLKIIRADGSVVTVSTKEIFGAGAKQKYMMYPGDTMFVPHTAEIPWALISSLLGIISVSLGIVLSVNALAKK